MRKRILVLLAALTACGVSDPQPPLVGCIDAYADVATLAGENRRLEGADRVRRQVADRRDDHDAGGRWQTAIGYKSGDAFSRRARDHREHHHQPAALPHLRTALVQPLHGATDVHAADLAERATGQSWAEIFRTRMAEPLEMPNTSFGTHANPALSEGDVVSTLDDYGHFAEMILGRGLYRGRRVLSESAIDQMRHNWTAGVQIVSSPQEDVPYGLGSWLDSTDAAGRGVIVSSPGAGGFIPIVDYPRNAIIVFVAQDERIWPAAREIIAGVRTAIDQRLMSGKPF